MKILKFNETENRIDVHIKFRRSRIKHIEWFKIVCLEMGEGLIGKNVWELTEVAEYKNGKKIE